MICLKLPVPSEGNCSVIFYCSQLVTHTEPPQPMCQSVRVRVYCHLSPDIGQCEPQWEDNGQDDKIGNLFSDGVWPSQAQWLVFIFLFLQNLKIKKGKISGIAWEEHRVYTCTIVEGTPYLVYFYHTVHRRRDFHRDFCAVGDVFISFWKDRKERIDFKGLFYFLKIIIIVG